MAIKEISHGAKSTVFEDENKPDLIIKENRQPEKSDEYWLSNQMKGYNIIKRIRESGLDYGVELPELIEIIDTPKKQIIEKKLYGSDFTNSIYNALDEEKKEQLAIQMAKFFNAMHQMEEPKPSVNPLSALASSNIKSTEDIINVFENNLLPGLAKALIDAEKYLKTMDKSDEINVNTHTDIRAQNVMYNPKKNKLSVIDFEMTKFDNIYNDFVPRCRGLNWDFIQRVIRHYNNIPNKKYHITINPDKVKNGLILSIAREMADCLYLDKQENPDTDSKKRANLLLHKLTKEEGLLNFSKQDIFNQVKSDLMPKKYYHGSNVDIQGDYLQPREMFNNVQDKVVSGAFVTSDENHAKFFAINHCISGQGLIKQNGNKIYFERLANNIKPYFFVYTVYETPDNKFLHDRGTEYYSTQPIKIVERTKCDTAKEIEKLGYEMYVLNEPLKTKLDKKSGNNLAMQQEMDDVIKQKKYHRVDIASMIEQKSLNKLTIMCNKSFGRKND